MKPIQKISETAMKKGRFLGTILWKCRFRREIILKNLHIAFPEKNMKWKQNVGKKCFQSIASVLFQFMKLPACFHSGELDEILKLEKGEELLDKYREQGAVLVSCHLGNWELAGARISASGNKVTALAYRQKNNRVHRYMHKIRTSCNMDVVYHRDSMRPLISKLKQGEFIAFLADQNTTSERGIFVDFFGKTAIAVDLPAKLAVKLKKPLLFFCAVYDEKDHQYHMRIEELKSDSEMNRPEDIERIVTLYTARIEKAIRQHPEQYLWFHKRWKTRPGTESSVY
ncbi:MAG: lysophospholipid acyltransferase family protein [Acidobacteria bacterium]|nr:lysophospholipid acyltransferase family protein [Acidobacteriota bacterium]